jgi:ABC-type sugar transport system ATPase subunit
MAMTAPYLKLTEISKSFPGVKALNAISLEAYSGEVLGLIGANGAGKSTLMNVLGGVVRMDSGSIEIGGKVVDIRDPLDASARGIAFVHQEMALLPTMTIAENMYIASFPLNKVRLIDSGKAVQNCKEALDSLGFSLSPKAKIKELGAGDRQMVEVARALLGDPRILIFDEPTSSLSEKEKNRLFEVIRKLKAEGKTVIYITHFLDEVFTLCDRAAVLRNGEVAGTLRVEDMTYEAVVKLMLGKSELTPERGASGARRSAGAAVLKVSGLCRTGVFKDVSFELRSGEVVGLWGLLGSGRTELVRSVAGLDPVDGGEIAVNSGGALKRIRPREARSWIGLVTENRREDGLLLASSVRANISLASLPDLLSKLWPFIDEKREKTDAAALVKRLDIKISDMEQSVGTLSGGNQQKVILSRWLRKNPPVLILDEPTRGLDVGAKGEIQEMIVKLARDGAAIMVISSEIEEIMSVSDRYLVIDRGRIVAELDSDASKERLLAAALGAGQGAKP